MASSFRRALVPWLLASFVVAPLACQGTQADPGGGPNYGEGYIGYRSAATAEQSAGNVSGDPAWGAADDGFSTGTGGSTSLPGTGGAIGLGGLGGMGSLEIKRQPALLPGERVLENPYFASQTEPTSTFSIDVDSGSYTLARAAIRSGNWPDPKQVRVEEFLNYFNFHYREPTGDDPLVLYTELGDCPWNEERKLLLLGVQGQTVKLEDQPPLNLVYLIDVSGSMNDPQKLPLLKQGFRMLTRLLRPQDRVSIVTYAGADRVVLDGVQGSDRSAIFSALQGLQSGGSTNGAGGIQKAYELAQKHFIEGGSNRILLATDGDFNVGLSEVSDLVALVAEKRKTGVDLSVYGYGSAWDGGNYRDEVGEQLADNGNGIYFYIDGEEETRRAFGYTLSGSLMTVARDVKLQVEFNPAHIKGYRLIGYENRVLANNAFDDDTVDAGELGAGLSVTALYEIIPADSRESLPVALPGTENLPKAGEAGEAADGGSGGPLPLAPGAAELAQIRLRFKLSVNGASQLRSLPLSTAARSRQPSAKFLFAAGVAEFAQQLRGSQYVPALRTGALIDQVEKALALDREGAVREVRDLVATVGSL